MAEAVGEEGFILLWGVSPKACTPSARSTPTGESCFNPSSVTAGMLD